jgi:hypothetical protein
MSMSRVMADGSRTGPHGGQTSSPNPLAPNDNLLIRLFDACASLGKTPQTGSRNGGARRPARPIALVSFVVLLLAAMLGVVAQKVWNPVKATDHSELAILPLTVAVSFFLIADIDSPRGGVVQILPLKLTRLAQSLNAP